MLKICFFKGMTLFFWVQSKLARTEGNDEWSGLRPEVSIPAHLLVRDKSTFFFFSKLLEIITMKTMSFTQKAFEKKLGSCLVFFLFQRDFPWTTLYKRSLKAYRLAIVFQPVVSPWHRRFWFVFRQPTKGNGRQKLNQKHAKATVLLGFCELRHGNVFKSHEITSDCSVFFFKNMKEREL